METFIYLFLSVIALLVLKYIWNRITEKHSELTGYTKGIGQSNHKFGGGWKNFSG